PSPHLYVLHSLPRPPTPPLFPYTTLFRSDTREERGAPLRRVKLERVADRVYQCHRRQPRADGGAIHRRVDLRDGSAQPPRQLRGDRKSTRLNSSHVEISYAVFCLKKKNYSYVTDTQVPIHDICRLPHGNVNISIWESNTSDDAIAAGLPPEPVGHDCMVCVNPLDV